MELEIESLAAGGRGCGRLADGRVAFVEGALPGDRVLASIEREKARFVEARRTELLRPSPLRRPSPCSQSSTCGGCDWIELQESAQRQFKAQLLKDALLRVGGLAPELVERLEWVESPRPLAYRSRLRLLLQGSQIGLRERGSHRLQPLQSCAVAGSGVNELLAWLSEYLRRHPAPDALTEVEIRVLSEGEEPGPAGLHFSLGEAGLRSWSGLEGYFRELAQALPRGTGLSHPLLRPEQAVLQPWAQAGSSLLLPLGAFSQVNLGINHLLVERVCSLAEQAWAEPTARRRFLDLFGGAGNFSFPLLKRGGRGVLMESSPFSVAAAKKRWAELNSGAAEERPSCGAPDQLRFYDGRVEAELHRLGQEVFDFVVVDPPRAGAAGLISQLLPKLQGILVWIGCDPVAFARDLKEVRAAGAELLSLSAFDMFPQTHHLESFAVFRAPSGLQGPDSLG